MEENQSQPTDGILAYRFLGWKLVSAWHNSLTWQILGQGTIDPGRYLFGNKCVYYWRKTYDPYINKMELYRHPRVNSKIPYTHLPDFQYQPLPSPSHIRLVRIIHGHLDSDLQIAFSDVDLSLMPEFETLSYVWGVERHLRVECEGTSVVVRENLYDALHALRSATEDRLFWIDALCINQDDLNERAAQVSLMRAIYAASQRTAVWLGKVKPLSEKALELLELLSTTPTKPRNEIYLHEYDKVWSELGILFANAWFYRIWIIQEIVVAKQVVIMLGSEIWPWEKFAEASRVALHYCRFWQTDFDPLIMAQLNEMREAYHRDGLDPFILPALQRGRAALATLDVDKIYAILGFTKENFGIDYKEAADVTYLRLANEIVTREYGLSLLDYVDDHLFRYKRSLPSWVPDWEVRHGSRPLRSAPESLKWDACSGIPSSVSLSHKNRRLHVRGIIIDKLERIGEPFIQPVPVSGAPKRVPLSKKEANIVRRLVIINEVVAIRRVQQWYSLAMKFGTMYESETRYNAFIQTLIAGHMPQDDETRAFVEKSYALWCKVWETASGNMLTNALWAYTQYPAEEMSNALQFMQMHVYAAWGRRFFTSRQRGIMGLCPSLARRHGLLVILNGSAVPVVLRQQRDGTFRFIGQCYAHGLMYGEAKDLRDLGQSQEFQLV